MSIYADAIRRQAEDAPRAALPAVTALLWRAYGEDHITEAEAEALSALIEARQVSSGSGKNPNGMRPDLRSPFSGTSDPPKAPTDRHSPQDRQRSPRTGVGSRPRSDASLERRRRWAASGRLPPALAARFTLAELAVLSLVGAETAKRGDCRLPIGQLAAVAGVSESTVRNALREARKLGLLTVEERRLAAWRSDSNIVRIVSPEWTAWLRLGRRSPIPGNGLSLRREHKGGGCKFVNPTSTQSSNLRKTRTATPSQGRAATPDQPTRQALRKAGA